MMMWTWRPSRRNRTSSLHLSLFARPGVVVNDEDDDGDVEDIDDDDQAAPSLTVWFMMRMRMMMMLKIMMMMTRLLHLSLFAHLPTQCWLRAALTIAQSTFDYHYHPFH